MVEGSKRPRRSPKGHVMSNRIRNAGRRVGRVIRTAGRRYVEMMAKCDPNGYGYYVW
jgi:hypothetical protein